MTRRDLLFSAASLLSVKALGGAASKPNVLILLADDLGWSDVGYHGSEIRTPNIDRLASQGVKFEHAYSCPVCSPTRSGLMTGRAPVRLGLGYTVIRPWSDYGVPVRERFLPQAFHDAGYQTAITGKWHLGHGYRKFLPQSRGFDRAYGHLNGAIDYFTHEREGGLDWSRNGKSVREDGYSTSLLGEEAIRFIKGRDRARPFFLYVPFNSPHAPLQAPPEFLDQYANIADPKRRSYAAMVAAMDSTIGKVLATLDDEKIGNDTLVLFFSDNGGPINQGATNKPLRGAKATAFEGGTRVPALLRWPGKLKAGSASKQVLSMMDYFPTLAGAAGVNPGNSLPFDGQNLWSSITAGKVETRRDIFLSVEAGGVVHSSLRDEEWKLVRQASNTGNVEQQLFHIGEDPSERNDLSAKKPQLVRELASRSEKWLSLHPANGVRASEAPPAGWRAPKQWIEAAKEA